MQRLLFEYSPFWILACLAAGVAYAWLLYQRPSVWAPSTNKVLAVFRAIVVSILCFLLIGPVLKLTTQETEKPAIVLLADNSSSVAEVLDSAARSTLVQRLEQVRTRLAEAGFQATLTGLDGQPLDRFNATTSDIQQAIKKTVGDYEGKNLAAIALVSDGIYNSGVSPLYTPLRTPVFTIGLGDTTERADISLRNLAYNKIAYQGNRFPLHAEVLIKGDVSGKIRLTVFQAGRQVASEEHTIGTQPLLAFDFLLDAEQTGLQRIDLQVTPLPQEFNTRNNRSAVFVEVVEGKKKILLAAPAPHPDVKAMRAAIEKNSNYEVVLHIPGAAEAPATELAPANIDLAIFFQAWDEGAKTNALLQRFMQGKSGLLLVAGSNSNLKQWASAGIAFENLNQKDEVTPVLNTSFRDFVFSDNLAGTLAGYPPVTVPFGKFTFPPASQVLLHQKIGSVATTRPLLFSWQEEGRKMAALLGEGTWRWRLHEYAAHQKTDHFDELFAKLVQYLSTQDDKRRFRSFPIQNEFSDAEPVIFESQVYNELFEPVFGNTIQLELRNEQGEVANYSYTTSPSGTRYRIGNLKGGVYRYRAFTEINDVRQEAGGEFLVSVQNLEAQNLTADFGLLRRLAENTGGKFYQLAQLDDFVEEAQTMQAHRIIHAEDSFHPIINLKAFFFLLLVLISAEWLARKYLGAY